MGHWVCQECYDSLGERECFTIYNWVNRKCVLCKVRPAVHCVVSLEDKLDNVHLVNRLETKLEPSRFRDAVSGLGEQLDESFAAMTTALGGLAESFKRIIPELNTFYNAIYQTYLDNGAPYGESPEGMMRWIEEVNRINHHLTEARLIESHHRTLVKLRQSLKERGLKPQTAVDNSD